MPTYFIARDAECYSSPDDFQPWRFYEKRKLIERPITSINFVALVQKI